jgi:hypothetical protein
MLLLIILNALIKEFEKKAIINENKGYKVQEYTLVDDNFPLFADDISFLELQALIREAFFEQNEVILILKTIRCLEDIIITYYNENHERLIENFLDEKGFNFNGLDFYEDLENQNMDVEIDENNESDSDENNESDSEEDDEQPYE